MLEDLSDLPIPSDPDGLKTDAALDDLLQLTLEKLGETQREAGRPVDTKASIISLLRETSVPSFDGDAPNGGGRHSSDSFKGPSAPRAARRGGGGGGGSTSTTTRTTRRSLPTIHESQQQPAPRMQQQGGGGGDGWWQQQGELASITAQGSNGSNHSRVGGGAGDNDNHHHHHHGKSGGDITNNNNNNNNNSHVGPWRSSPAPAAAATSATGGGGNNSGNFMMPGSQGGPVAAGGVAAMQQGAAGGLGLVIPPDGSCSSISSSSVGDSQHHHHHNQHQQYHAPPSSMTSSVTASMEVKVVEGEGKGLSKQNNHQRRSSHSNNTRAKRCKAPPPSSSYSSSQQAPPFSSLGSESGVGMDPDLEAKYGAIDRDPEILKNLLLDPLFTQCCVDAGINPFTLFPATADEAASRTTTSHDISNHDSHHPSSSSTTSQKQQHHRHTKASFDMLLKKQYRPTVLSIGPELLQNPSSRRDVVCAILREYEEARRTEAIRRRDETRRMEKSRAFVGNVAEYFSEALLDQRARSQGLLERVHRLRVNEDEALHSRKEELEAQRRHKEEVLRAYEEAEMERRRNLIERGEEHTKFCESIQRRKDEMLEMRRQYCQAQLADRTASAMERVSSAWASRYDSLARRREEEEVHRQRCKSEADSQSEARRRRLLDMMERKAQSYEDTSVHLQEERKTHTAQKRAAEVMHHWSILRRKAYVDVSRRNARLEKVQGADNVNKVVKAFLEALAKEQSMFEKFQVHERREMKEQERDMLKYLTPGPGHYLGLDAARVLKPVRGFKITKTSSSSSDPNRKIAGGSTSATMTNPGPGDYDVASSCASQLTSLTGGGHFSTAKGTDYISEELRRFKDTPGPGSYEFPSRRVKGCRFSQARLPSELEKAVKRAKETPGPGDYMNPDRPTDLIKPFIDQFRRLSRNNLEELARRSVISGEDSLVMSKMMMAMVGAAGGRKAGGTTGAGGGGGQEEEDDLWRRRSPEMSESQWTTVPPPPTGSTSSSYDGRGRQAGEEATSHHRQPSAAAATSIVAPGGA